ncbi:hypothetical protein DFH06DRAFT_1335585 [Mycena polygramma]|nr:hypothetical protein DFH06DRAFT_1335585 [Mycena polygramma]
MGQQHRPALPEMHFNLVKPSERHRAVSSALFRAFRHQTTIWQEEKISPRGSHASVPPLRLPGGACSRSRLHSRFIGLSHRFHVDSATPGTSKSIPLTSLETQSTLLGAHPRSRSSLGIVTAQAQERVAIAARVAELDLIPSFVYRSAKHHPGGLLLQIRHQRTLGISGAFDPMLAPAVVRATQSRGDVLFLSMRSSTQYRIVLCRPGFLCAPSPGASWSSVAAIGLRPRHRGRVLPILDLPGLLLIGQTHNERRAIGIEIRVRDLPLRCLHPSATELKPELVHTLSNASWYP